MHSSLHHLVILLVVSLFVTVSAQAQVPAPGAFADASAASSGGLTNTDSDTGSTTASANATGSGSDLGLGAAEATVGGTARSNAQTSGASGAGASFGDGTARWVQQLVTAGTDPGGSIDVDLSFSVDGTLTYFNNNSGAGLDDIRSSIRAVLRVHDGLGTTTAFDGTAQLATVTNATPPALTRTGDWIPASRDGDFSTPGCGAFSCSYDVSATLVFDDAILVGFEDVFAVEIEINSGAFIFAGFETQSGADFFNTASLVVSTNTPGVTFQNVAPQAAPSTGPLAVVLLAGALMAIGIRVQVRRTTHSAGA